MSEEIKNDDANVDEQVVEDVIPAVLAEGEPLISEEIAEKYNDFVKTLEEKVVDATEAAEEPENVISSGSQGLKKPAAEVAGITAVAGGVIGTGTVKPKPKNVVKQKETPEVEKVAVFSSKNVTWTGVGKLYRGYNIVTKAQADKWLTRDHTRLATPEEVAREFNR